MARQQFRSSALEPRMRSDGVEKRLLHAAENGDALAQCNLGILYDNALDDNGRAVADSRPQALRWLLAAAEQGLPRAQVKLAEVYAEAPSRSGDYTTACGWLLVAVQHLRGIHRDRARLGYERLALHLTSEQTAEAARFARDWTPKLPNCIADLAASQADGDTQ